MNWILKIKHWQLFGICYVPQIVGFILRNYWSPLFFILGTAVYLIWIRELSVYCSAKITKVINQEKSNFVGLNLGLVLSFLSSSMLVILFFSYPYNNPNIPIAPFIIYFISTFYILIIVSKQLRLTIGTKAMRAGSILNNFALLLWYPIGIWYLQPVMNILQEEEQSLKE